MFNVAVLAVTAAVAFTCSRTRRALTTADDQDSSAASNSARHLDSHLYLYDVNDALALSRRFVEAHESSRACTRSNVSAATTTTTTNPNNNPTPTGGVDAEENAPSAKVKIVQIVKITKAQKVPARTSNSGAHAPTRVPVRVLDANADTDVERDAKVRGKSACESTASAGSAKSTRAHGGARSTVPCSAARCSGAEGNQRLSDGVSHLLPAVKPRSVVRYLYNLVQEMKNSEKVLDAGMLAYLNALHFKAIKAKNTRLGWLVEYVWQKNNILLAVLNQREHGGPSSRPPPISQL